MSIPYWTLIDILEELEDIRIILEKQLNTEQSDMEVENVVGEQNGYIFR